MNIYGVKGYLTPDNLPEDSHCRLFRIPNNVQWLSVFMGALLPLIYPENWQEYGELTPEESAEVMLGVIWDGYNNNNCFLDVEAPFWDDGTDAEAEQPANDQPWYGELTEIMGGMGAAEPTLEWHEELRLWAIVGFVAIAGSPLAAIAFAPFARKFVLAFKGGTAGAIVRVFFDGLHLADIDTYGVEDQIINFLVDVGIEPSGEKLWVEHSGEHNPAAEPDANDQYTVQVVRKQLDANEFSPTNLRYHAETDKVQQTYDGGTTWVNQPGQDPRHSVIYQYPPVDAGDPKCQAAANQTRFLNDTIDQALEAIALATDALGVALTLLPLFVELGPFAILFELVLGLADALVSAGADAVNDAFTPEVYDQLECIFYCNIEDDGSVTPEDLVAIEDQVAADIGGLVQVVIDAMLLLTGEVGLSNEGTVGDAPADCSACEEICPPVWAKTWNWQTTDYTGELDTAITIGSWSSGQGIVSADVPIDHRYASSEFVVVGHFDYGNQPCTIDHYEADVYKPSGSDQDCQIGAVAYIYPLSGTGEIHLEADGSFYDHSTENTTTHTFQNYTSNGPGSKPTMYYRRLKLSGTGHCPFVNPDP